MDDNQLDNFFKDNLDDFHSDAKPDRAWNMMIGRLSDASSGYFSNLALSRIAAVSLIGLLLLGGLVGFLFWNQHQHVQRLETSLAETQSQIQQQDQLLSFRDTIIRRDTVVIFIDQSGQARQITKEGLLPAEDLPFLSQYAQISPSRNPINPSSNINRDLNFNSQNSNQKPSNETTLPHGEKLKDQAQLQYAENQLNESKRVEGETKPDLALEKDSTDLSIKERREYINSKRKEIKEDLASSDSQNVDVEEKETSEEQKKEKLSTPQQPSPEGLVKKLKKNFAFRTGAGGSLGLGMIEAGETNGLFGGNVGVELGFKDRFAIRTGLNLSGVGYELSRSDIIGLGDEIYEYYPGLEALSADDIVPRELKSNGTFLQIPIGLRYYLPINEKIKGIVGVDVLGGKYLNQTFNYEYINESGEEIYLPQPSEVNPWTWGTGRFSLGAAYALKPKWILEGALFYEQDFEGRGNDDQEFGFIGVSASIWFSPSD